MRSHLWVILVLSSLYFGPISHFQLITGTQNNSYSQSYSVVNDNSEEYLPINYDIYDRYANGSIVYRETRNSFDQPKLNPDVSEYPFGNYQLSLGGSENLAYLSNSGFKMMEEVGTFPSSLDQSLINPDINIDSSTNPGSVAVGDFDGDHQSDLAIVYYSTDVRLKIYTHTSYYTAPITLLLSTPLYTPLADSQFVPTTNQIQQPQIVAGNFDDDPMDEFAVLCMDNNGVQQIIVFDDLMHSHIQQAIHYGDYIALSTFIASISTNQPTHYVQSTGSTLTYSSNDDYRTANWVVNTPIAADPSMRFKIIDPNDPSSTAQLGYGYPVSLQDQNGNYVGDDQGNVVLSPSITSNEIFTIRDETLSTESDAAIYELNTVAFESYTRNSIRVFLGVDTTSLFEGYNPSVVNPRLEYQIFSANALPEHFHYNSLPNITSISVPGIIRLIPDTLSDMIKGGSLNIISVNIDADNRSELVVAGLDSNDHPIAYLYDDFIAGNNLLHTFQWNSLTTVFPNIAAGDMNGDGLDELIFSYSTPASSFVEVYNNQYQLLQSIMDLNPGAYPTVKTGDIDNDAKDELLYLDEGSHLSIYDDQSNNFSPIIHNYFMFNTNDVTITDFESFGLDNQTRIQSFSTSYPQISIGDFDIDGSLEIGVNVYAYDTIPNEHYVTAIFSFESNLAILSYSIDSSGVTLPIPTLISGDFESDSYSVEFTGNHTLLTTPGELTAIAVASPVQSRIDQNYDDSNTLFGTSVSQSSSVNNEFSSSYGAFIKFEQEFGIFGIKFAQFETRVGFTFAFSLRNIQTSTTVTTTEFHGDASDDTVIFTTAIYDMYSFKVINSKYPGQIGKVFSISIPNTPALYKQHKSYYNQNTNGVNAQINSSIIQSTAGNLSSYMSHSELLQYIQSYATGAWLESDEVQIGQGEGYNTVKIDISQEDTTGFSTSYSFDFEASGGVFGLSFGLTFGLTSSHAYETTIGQSTSFGLDVGDIISEQDYIDYRYGFGLAVYQVDINNHGVIQSPWVINSWVTLPNGWAPPPFETSSNSGSEITDMDGTTNSNGFFGISLNSMFFVLTLLTMQLINRKTKRF